MTLQRHAGDDGEDSFSGQRLRESGEGFRQSLRFDRQQYPVRRRRQFETAGDCALHAGRFGEVRRRDRIYIVGQKLGGSEQAGLDQPSGDGGRHFTGADQ